MKNENGTYFYSIGTETLSKYFINFLLQILELLQKNNSEMIHFLNLDSLFCSKIIQNIFVFRQFPKIYGNRLQKCISRVSSIKNLILANL